MRQRTKPVGRILRVITGIILIAASVFFLIGASQSFLVRTFSILLALVIFYTLVYILVTRYFSHVNRWMGVVIANFPVLLVFLLGIPGGLLFGAGEGQLAVMIYMGISLLILGVKADPGCEVMTLQGLFFGRSTHLPCLVFSPIDWVEERLWGRGS